MLPSSSSNILTDGIFVRRVCITVGITLLALLLTGLLGAAFGVLLLVMAALLIALPLRAGVQWLSRRTNWPEGVTLFLFTLLVVGILGGMIWLLSARIGDQVGKLIEQAPVAFQQFRDRFGDTRWGQRLTELDVSPEKLLGGTGLLSRVSGVISSTLGVLGDLYVIIFLALFIVVQPQLYRQGILLLVPKPARPRAGEVLNQLNHTLVSWLMGTLFSMTVVGVLSGLGLWALGMPLAGALALYAGLITFIPNLGPILAMIPAVLFAFVQGPQQALYVALLYIGIQTVESNLLTPLVQRRLIAMPPALTLVGQLVIGLFSGVLGLMLATPIVAMVLVLVKMLYIQDVLDDDSVTV